MNGYKPGALSGPGAKSTDPGSDARFPSAAKSNENGTLEMLSTEASTPKLRAPGERTGVDRPAVGANDPPVPAIPPEHTKSESEGFDESPPERDDVLDAHKRRGGAP